MQYLYSWLWVKWWTSCSTALGFGIVACVVCGLGGCSSKSSSAEAAGGVTLPGNKTVVGVLMFGDSIVDTGNNNYIKTIARVNYPPYGMDFMGGKPTGRFSNGKVPSDFLAEYLGVKELLPPYLDPTLTIQDLLTGVNFASGGAGFDPLTSQIATALPLSDQLKLFKEYKGKLEGAVGGERSDAILSNSLFAVVAGSNDICNTYYSIPLRRIHYDISSYTDLMLGYASTLVQELYAEGARKIGVLSLPPLGCLPSQRTLAGGPQRECVQKYNQAAQLFNTKLSAQIDTLGAQLVQAKIVYIDIYYSLLDIIQDPQKYGFEIANKGCCGSGTIEVEYLCTSPCPDVSTHVFWDSFHPTQKAYAILVRQILRTYISKF